jgi:hypothetical protein
MRVIIIIMITERDRAALRNVYSRAIRLPGGESRGRRLRIELGV